MAHFAELDAGGCVTRVLVVNNAELLSPEGVEEESRGVLFLRQLYGHDRWRQTSYSGSMRGCYAGIGYRYDAERDVFVPPDA